MSDVVVTVPQKLWPEWLEEGDLPGEEAAFESHFWIGGPRPKIEPGERVYIVARGLVRGYAPLVRIEDHCALAPGRRCLLRTGGAVTVTPRCRRHAEHLWMCNRFETGCPETDHPLPVTGFRGVLYRWWPREIEMAFPEWMEAMPLRQSAAARRAMFAETMAPNLIAEEALAEAPAAHHVRAAGTPGLFDSVGGKA